MSPRVILLMLAALLVEAAVIVWAGPLAGMLIPSVGVALNFAFVVLKIGRTGALSTWGLTKHESTPLERQLQVAGLSLVAGSIILLWALGKTTGAG
jgi:hypothetical protein